QHLNTYTTRRSTDLAIPQGQIRRSPQRRNKSRHPHGSPPNRRSGMSPPLGQFPLMKPDKSSRRPPRVTILKRGRRSWTSASEKIPPADIVLGFVTAGEVLPAARAR